MTFWDLDGDTAPGITGQLHAILLNKTPGLDNFWFKHYQASELEQQASTRCIASIVSDLISPS